MRAAGLRVLVVGAGIAGLAAARTLRGGGAAVELLERAAGPDTAGAGIYLPGNAVRALTALGVGAEVAGQAVGIQRQRTSDHRGRLLFEIATADLWPGPGGCLALPRAELRRILAGGLDDVPIRWGVGPVELAQDAEGVHVTSSDGRTATYDLVVGADGVHSTVRRLAFPPDAAAPTPTDQTAWRFVVPWAGAPPVWSVWLGRGSALLTIPISAGSVYCYCDGPLHHPPPLPELLAGYAEPAGFVLDALSDPAVHRTMHVASVEEVALTSWTSGRVVLLGDSAHASAPNMAQGAAAAVEDALVLADCLSDGAEMGPTLAAYERRRRPRTDWIRVQTHRRDRARSLPVPVRRTVLRRFGVRMTHGQFGLLREPF